MSDIKFNCPHCHQRLAVPEAALGRTISCPICSGHIGLPAKKTPAAAPGAPPADAAPRPVGNTPPPPKGEIRFSCSKCTVNIVIDERAAGRKITCQRCGSQLIVPGQAANAPRASQPPPLPQTQEAVAALIEKLRGGDEEAGKTLLRLGESVISLLVDCFGESSLQDPDTNRGAEHIVALLAKCGAACVPPLIAKLGKSRHAYFALAKIGTEDAINVLLRELSSVNWRRAETACKALGAAETPHVQKIVGQLEALRKSTRIGEVFAAAGAALAALQARGPQAAAAGAAMPQAKVTQPVKPLNTTRPLGGV